MTAYLREHPPVRSQFRSPRRARPNGVICLHTAESALDTIGPDTGAENVASWMTRRTTPGSYHDLADSDSYVHLVDYDHEAYHDGSGSNPWSLSISFALAAADWPRLSVTKRAAFLAQGARAFAAQQKWLLSKGYPLTPLRRITKAQSDAGIPGFVAHGDRDPGRRTDPGEHFPWHDWFAACLHATGGHPPTEEDDITPEQGSAPAPAPAPTPPAPTPPSHPVLREGSRGASVAGLVDLLYRAGFGSGLSRTVDIFGSKTTAAVVRFQKARGLGVDGVVGPQTWDALLGDAPPTAPAPSVRPTLRRGASGDHVRHLQRRLLAHNYDIGRAGADGDFGPSTDGAVRRFQKNKGLTADGVVGPNTWARLNSPA